MAFNSLTFIGFYAAVAAVFFAVPSRMRWLFLLAASYIFYAWHRWDHLLMILASTTAAYLCGLAMGMPRFKKWRGMVLLAGLTLSIGNLIAFKYMDFLACNILFLFDPESIQEPVRHFFSWAMPLGVSFHTFQTVSYEVDVYRGNVDPQRHFGLLALYLCFFPTIVSGPIERSPQMFPQFLSKISFDYERVVSGLHLMLWGFVKKLVIADRLGIAVDTVFSSPAQYSGINILIAVLFYAYQIYCDFSGYSDIAIGAARVLGINLTLNFNNPYHARSISDFWRRWHISLSNWLRDYLFLPISYRLMRAVERDRIAGLKIESWSYVIAIVITMGLSGLWHGANWTFVIWGLLHGFYMAVSHMTRRQRKKIARYTHALGLSKIHDWFKIGFTFFLLAFSLVFFRASSVGDAFTILRNSLSGIAPLLVHLGDTAYLRSLLGGIGMDRFDLFIGMASILILEIIQVMGSRKKTVVWFQHAPAWIKGCVVHAEFICLILFGSFNSGQTFIYFQF